MKKFLLHHSWILSRPVCRALFCAVLIIAVAPPVHGGAMVEEVDDGISVRDDRIGISYRVPLPPEGIYHQGFQGIFNFANEPFRFLFTGTQTFMTDRTAEPNTFYHFAYFLENRYRVYGDGSYDNPTEKMRELGWDPSAPAPISPEERAGIFAEREEFLKTARFLSEPADIFAALRQKARRRWKAPAILDSETNGGAEYLPYLDGAALTTKQASLPDTVDGAFATRLDYVIEGDSGLPVTSFTDNALYFAHGPRVIKIGAMDLLSRSEEEIFAVLNGWREAIIRANPFPDPD